MNKREQKLHDEALHMIGVSVSLRLQPQIEAIERSLATLNRALVEQDNLRASIGAKVNSWAYQLHLREEGLQKQIAIARGLALAKGLRETVRRAEKRSKRIISKTRGNRPESVVIGGIRIKAGKRGPLMGSKGAEKIRRAQQRRWKKAKRR